MPRLHPPFIFLISLALSSPTVVAQNSSHNADREIRKLEALGVEELSAQDLTDAYVACIASNSNNPEVGIKPKMSLGDLRRACQDERKNLALKLSQKSIDEMDRIFVERFNEVATRADAASGQ